VAVSCEHDYEHSDSIEDGEVPDWLSHYWLPKKSPPSWNESKVVTGGQTDELMRNSVCLTVLNEDVWRSGCIAPSILNLDNGSR